MYLKIFATTTVLGALILFGLNVSLNAEKSTENAEAPELIAKSKKQKERSKKDILKAWGADPKAPTWEMGDLAPWKENGKIASDERRGAAPFWMGPAGFKAKLNRDARTYVVTEISPGSPADGKIKIGETIIGANKVVFADSKGADEYPTWARSNVLYGNSIIESWEKEATLDLLVTRGEKTVTVAIDIPGIGKFGPKFPVESELGDALISMSCELIASRQANNGGWGKGEVGQSSSNKIATCFCGLALMASGESKYKSQVKQAATWIASGGKVKGFHTWMYAFQSVFLGEYYLATKDKKVLPTLQLFADELALGQFDYYGSGHGNHSGNYRGNGIAICTTHALTGMAYAKLCGCKVDSDRLTETMGHIERISPHGSVPYTIWGNNISKLDTPVPSEPASRNEHAARSGSAAAAFHLLGGNSEQLKRIGKFLSTNSDYMDNGHSTGNSLSWFWGSMGLWLTDEKAFAEHMNRRRWWLAMKRRHDGGTMALPAECINHRKGDRAMGPNVEVAIQALVLAATKRNLLLCGKELKDTNVDKRKTRLLPMAYLIRHKHRIHELRMLIQHFDQHVKKATHKKAAIKFIESCIKEWAALDPDDRKLYEKKHDSVFLKQVKVFKNHLKNLEESQRSLAVELFTGIKLHAQAKEMRKAGMVAVFAGYVPFGEITIDATMLLDSKKLASATNTAKTESRLEYKTKVLVLRSGKQLWQNGKLLELNLTATWQGLTFKRRFLPIKPAAVPEYGYTGSSPLIPIEVVIVGWNSEGMKATTPSGQEVTYSTNATGRFTNGKWQVLGKKDKKSYAADIKLGESVELLVYEEGPNRWFLYAINTK